MERYSSLINNLVDLLCVNNKSFEEIVQSFNIIVNIVFEDGIHNCGRIIAVESFARIVADRAAEVYKNCLHKTLMQRIESEHSKWYNNNID